MNLGLDDARYPRHLNPSHILGSQYPSAHGDVTGEEEEAESDGEDNDNNGDGEFDLPSESLYQDDGSEEEDLSQFPHLFLEDSIDESGFVAEDYEQENGGQLQALDEGLMEVEATISPSSRPYTSVFTTMQELDDLIIASPSTSGQSSKRQRTRGTYRPEANLNHTIDCK